MRNTLHKPFLKVQRKWISSRFGESFFWKNHFALRTGKTILAATNTSLSKVNFREIPLEGCVQHRILFSPPPDPVEQARNENVSDEFFRNFTSTSRSKISTDFGRTDEKNKRFLALP